MAAIVASSLSPAARAPRPARSALQEAPWARSLLIAIALLFLVGFLVLPLAAVFAEAFRHGVGAYFKVFTDPDTLAAVRLTLLAAAISVPANLVFGIAAAWAIARFNFRGKSVLTTLIDLPFAVSPVIAGLMFVLVFGLQGWFGGWLIRARYRR